MDGFWKPYVPVAKRKADAARYAANLAKKERRVLAPITLNSRKIADTFWGKAWCENLETYSDFKNRLPRGQTYVRNGSVIDLRIEAGQVTALVSGSEVYTVKIEITPLAKATWGRVKADCAQSIDSMLDLLAGRFDKGVMERMTHREDGLFPKPREIKLRCSCPDWATMCKHCAAVLYGIGSRLDSQPEMLFSLRGVDHTELVGAAVSSENLDRSLGRQSGSELSDSVLGEMFGIDLVTEPAVATTEKKVTSKSKVKAKPAAKAAKRTSRKPAS